MHRGPRSCPSRSVASPADSRLDPRKPAPVRRAGGEWVWKPGEPRATGKPTHGLCFGGNFSETSIVPTTKVKWAKSVEDDDCTAATAYLSLSYSKSTAKKIVVELRKAPEVWYAAKDLLRASRLPTLGDHDSEVMKDLKKIRHGKVLAPVLLIRGSAKNARLLDVADGYHRICAAYHFSEKTLICCRLVDPR
jgi:hypothetical protein